MDAKFLKPSCRESGLAQRPGWWSVWRQVISGFTYDERLGRTWSQGTCLPPTLLGLCRQVDLHSRASPQYPLPWEAPSTPIPRWSLPSKRTRTEQVCSKELPTAQRGRKSWRRGDCWLCLAPDLGGPIEEPPHLWTLSSSCTWLSWGSVPLRVAEHFPNIWIKMLLMPIILYLIKMA